MKPSPFLVVGLILLGFGFANASPWTHSASEGEDASSVHYYFFAEKEGKVERVRWVWNGGAQDDPTVTDFLIGPESITIREFKGKRESLKSLVSGSDEGMVLDWESIIKTGGKPVGEVLKTAAGLSEENKVDLENLEGILSNDRKAIR